MLFKDAVFPLFITRLSIVYLLFWWKSLINILYNSIVLESDE